MPDIFLSYSRDDQATARRFADGFECAGLSVWWDATLRSGEAYDQVTEKALREAGAVVVLWSKKSVESRWVRSEATLADRNRTLLPAMIEPCQRPIMFELTQTAELGHWQGAADDRAWLAFLADARRLVEQYPAATPGTPSTIRPALAMPAAGERGDAPSLAVLPFTNRSGLAEDEIFAIGMVEDVIDALSQGVYVRVISSTATARFRSSAIPDLDAMARQLGVRYLLEGNVRRTGPNLRVTAQLIEARSGEVLWTQKFDQPLSELAALQEQLVLEVAAHLDAQVYRVEMERALKKPGDLTAWEAVMRAIAARRSITSTNASFTVAEARKAVAIAPDYGLAHAVLAMAAGHRYLLAASDDPDELRDIRGHTDRALALDPDNALVLAHASLALTYIGRAEDGLRHGERAVALNPGAAVVHLSCGVACLWLYRIDEALKHLAADLRASPGAQTNFFNYSYQGSALMSAARWDEAATALDLSLDLYPDYPAALQYKAALCMKKGSPAEAHELMLRLKRKDPNSTLPVWEKCLARVFGRSPNHQVLLDLLRGAWAGA